MNSQHKLSLFKIDDLFWKRKAETEFGGYTLFYKELSHETNYLINYEINIHRGKKINDVVTLLRSTFDRLLTIRSRCVNPDITDVCYISDDYFFPYNETLETLESLTKFLERSELIVNVIEFVMHEYILPFEENICLIQGRFSFLFLKIKYDSFLVYNTLELIRVNLPDYNYSKHLFDVCVDWLSIYYYPKTYQKMLNNFTHFITNTEYREEIRDSRVMIDSFNKLVQAFLSNGYFLRELSKHVINDLNIIILFFLQSKFNYKINGENLEKLDRVLLSFEKT